MSSNLQLNLHWHVLLADGVWTEHDGHATFHPAEPLDTMRVQETLHDAVLRIDKVLQRKGWQNRDDDPFAESQRALAELWKAALLGRPIDDSVAVGCGVGGGCSWEALAVRTTNTSGLMWQ